MTFTSVSESGPGGRDTLLLDVPAASHLVAVLAGAARALRMDRLVLESMLHDATTITRRDQLGALTSIASAGRRLDALSEDLRARVSLVESTRTDMGRIDELTAAIGEWGDAPVGVVPASALAALAARRHALVLGLVGGDTDMAAMVESALARGLTIDAALPEVNDRVQHDLRVAGLADELGLGLAEARSLLARIDRDVDRLVRAGHSRVEATAVVSLVVESGLELGEVRGRAAERGIELALAVGELLFARALGLTVAELDALAGLEQHFAVFDNATGGAADGRVSAADLEYVVAHPWRFTCAQVAGAEALLATPELRNRLDTADENDDVLAGAHFGRREPGDGLIAEADLRAFMVKAQIHHLLGDYADRIDVAADSSGVVDGYLSENDFKAFLADNPDLPESVVAATEVMLANGWFDESWWQSHKDELATGVALLAGGIVVVATGGGASLVLLVGVGALAAAGTTIAINLATGDDLLDDVFANGLRGVIVGGGVHAVVAGAGAYSVATSTLARSTALAGATAGATDVVAVGGLDLLVPEDDEALVHDLAGKLNMVASGWDATYGDLDAAAVAHGARFETIAGPLEALSATIDPDLQARHVAGSGAHAEGYGGHVGTAADAQAVLDAVHDGSGDILGRTRAGDLLVRVEGVEGIDHNPASRSVRPTDVFVVKGTSSPAVVPTSTQATPADPASVVGVGG